MKQLPNILTLANLFCGALAIVFVLQAPTFISSFNGQQYLVTAPPPIYWASVLIGIAAVFDFLDGFAARLLKVKSAMGRELDSLADVVTFGVAPGMILYQLLRSAYMHEPGAMDVSLLGVVPALLLPCFAAYRLAKFNIDDRQKETFLGVPTPAVGLLVASFPLLMLQGHLWLHLWLQKVWVLYLLIACLCVLMVCNVPFFSLKMKTLAWKQNALRYILIVLVLVSIPFLKWAAVPFAFALYVVLSIGKYWFFPD
ncbi:MAG TPA: CDP-diacylglycerol--serine O-phosphatidyltransferase [Chitinophagaceae bacterium]|nr:CDP-diacylglycerol--serine O-phosphatidyltransferase [Chitinophagaceae bacterium]